MSNTITAYFKGRVGVAESVYQNDYGMVMNFDSIELPAHFDCYFSILNQEEAIPGVGADRMVAIPNSVLANPGAVTIHIPIHTGANDSEVEYVVYFKVIGRARPIDDGTPTQMTAIEQALALLQNPITNIEQIVNEALSFTGDTFDEMQDKLDADQAAFQDDMGDRADAFEAGISSRQSQVEHDFDVLDGQFQTAVAAITVDSEVQGIRTGDDGKTYTSAGEAVRKQFAAVKSDLANTDIARHISLASGNVEAGKFINDQGVKASSEAYNLTYPFSVKSGSVIKINARAAETTALIAKVDGTSYVPLLTGTGAYAEAVYPVFEDMSVVLSYVNWNDYDTKCVVLYNPSENIEKLTKYTSKKAVSYDVVAGKYIDSYGTEQSVSSYNRSTPISLSALDSITVKARGNEGVAIISEYIEGTFVPLELGTNEYAEFTYTAPKNMQVVISYLNWLEYAPQVSVYGKIELIQEVTNTLSSIALGQDVSFGIVPYEYVDPTTREITANPGLARSVAIPVNKGELVEFTARGYLSAVGMIATCSSDGTTIYDVPCVSVDSTVRLYKYLVEEDGYIMLSFSSSYEHSLVIGSQYSNKALRESIEHGNNAFDYGTFSMFEQFGVIGDSWSSGVIYRQSGGGDDDNTYRNLSWGKILARNTGTDCTLYSVGGATTRSWLSNVQNGLTKLLSDNAKQLYIVMLGINDSNTLGADYLGSLSDITSDDYATYPDTFYGNYGKIVGNIKAHAPSAKIVLITAPKKEDAVRIAYNNAIEAIANRFGVICIKMHEDEYFNSDYFTRYVSGHPVAATYSGMAKRFEKLIVDTFNTRFSYWKDYIG